MTISSTDDPRAGPFNGNGSQTVYPFEFKVFNKNDVRAVRTDANGIEYTEVLDSNYSVTLNADQDNDPGGDVTLMVALPVGETLTIVSDLDFTQTTDITNGGGFYPQVIENALDRNVMLIKQVNEEVGRALRLPVSADSDVDGTLPVPQANFLIGWDSSGTGLRNVDGSTLATIVAFGTWESHAFDGDGVTTIFTLSSDPGNVDNLDVVVSGVPQRNGIDFSLSGTTLTFTDPPVSGTDNVFVRWGEALPQGSASNVDDAEVVVTQPYPGAIPASQDEANAQYTFGHQFGIDTTGVSDSTIALQNLVNSKRRPSLELNSIVKISATIDIPSDCDLDLNGSEIQWAGTTLTNANKASRFDYVMFKTNGQPPGTIKHRVRIRNGVIKANDAGFGIIIKQTEDFELSGLEIYQAQCQGIMISDSIDGRVEKCKFLDCAANPSAGFDPATDLEGWSDGILIFYGSQNVTVTNCRAVSTRAATGRCGFVIDGSISAESGRDCGNIRVANSYAVGYDRAGHVELAYSSGFDNCELVFTDIGTKTFSCAAVSWNAVDAYFRDCKIVSSKALFQGIGGNLTTVTGGSFNYTGAGAQVMFKNTGPIQFNVVFNGVVFDFGPAGNANLYYTAATFNDCTISASAYRRSDFYQGGKLSLNRCTITNVGFTLALGAATDTIEATDCTFVGMSGTNYVLEIGATQVSKMHRCKLPASSKFYLDGKLFVSGMDFADAKAIGFDTAGSARLFVDGDLLSATAPATGTWVQGQRTRHPTPAAAGFIGQVCVTAGTPGTWKTYGAISA